MRVDRTGTGYVATLDLGGGVSPRVFRASRCEELVSATVLALALAVNEPGDGEPFDAARPPDPAASETAASAAATTLVPAGQLASRDIGDVPSALPRSSAGGLRLDVAALMVTGVVGGGSYGMQAGAAWAWARWELRGGARFVRLGVRPEQVGALVTAPLDACLRRAHDAFEVAACARLEVGASANPDRSVAPWLAPGVVGRLRFGERAAFFGVDVELGAPLVHSPTLPVAEGPTLAIAVGMGARI